MTDWRKKYKREQQARDDKAQAVLAPEKQSFMRERGRVISTSSMALTGQYMCPFCLYVGNIQKFLVSTKKGVSQKTAKCPDCGNTMRMKTLTYDFTIEQFAQWCCQYALSGFWKKVPFQKFNRRLKELGIRYRFWKAYKIFKGEDTTESYEDYIARKQREEYEDEERNREANQNIIKHWKGAKKENAIQDNKDA